MAYTTIDDPSAYFQALVYAGTGGLNVPVTHTNTGNSDLQPDLIWFKDIGASYQHYLVDSSRGRAAGLHPDDNSAETTTGAAGNDLVSFDTDGFKVGSPSEGNSTNGGTTNKVAWQWKANAGTTSTNSDGDINSTVQVNTTAGFSIVQYNPSNTTTRNIGHGLGVKPDCILIRNRTRVENWRMWFNVIGQGALTLDGSGTYTVNSNLVNSATTSTFNVGGDFSVNGNYPYVAYCFNNVQGYSKFGKYVGNGDATNGPFVFLGFSPAFVMIKNTETANRPWYMFDNKRKTFNPNGSILKADTSDAEATDQAIDMLSNGFKVRPDALGSFGTSTINHSGQKMVYMAFAESPFTSSTGIPTTAR
tara:strand:- start:460 stop:1542 length:1083 start_codon:yes stop_codon:yes gene_type:complete